MCHDKLGMFCDFKVVFDFVLVLVLTFKIKDYITKYDV